MIKDEVSIPLTEEDIARVARTFSRDDTFTVLFLLAKATHPLALEHLCEKYGANPIEVKDRLNSLIHFGLIRRRGRAYIATDRARLAVNFLEERFRDTYLPVEVAVPGSPAACAFIETSYERFECFPTTNNGTWLSVKLSCPAVSSTEIIVNREQTITVETPTVNLDLTAKPNANRNQLYM